MVELVAIGFVAGILAGISPCILPVLPVVLVAGATTPAGAEPAGTVTWTGRGRPLAVVGGLVISFSLLVLAGSELLSLLGLPQDFLRDAGIVALIVVGIGFLVPGIGDLLERPFAGIRARQPTGKAGGFVLGLALGLLFAPCAGPVLAAITVVGATHRVGSSAVILTLGFAVGAAIPLLVVALAGQELAGRVRTLRRHVPALRRVSGAVLIVMAVAVGANSFTSLQRDIPGYTTALQESSHVRHQLGALTGTGHTSLAHCDETSSLVNCGPAPDFASITAWLNTPGGKPLSMAGLRGKVVLVDFWTYSCINCQRTLPHLEAWYSRYAADGLVIVGVHTPEFAFEHVVSNVRTEAAALGVHYPVAIDDHDATWDAYDNEYWPADYLIDAQGDVRHVHFGEGDYSGTEKLIRQLLSAAHPGITLPPPTDVPNKTPTGSISPETYVGYQRLQYVAIGTLVKPNVATAYGFPSTLPLGQLGFGGVWDDHAEEATAGPGAQLELAFLAHDVYLVAAGTGTLRVSVRGHPTETIHVGGTPRLYTLYHSGSLTDATLHIDASPGVEAYDFTFG